MKAIRFVVYKVRLALWNREFKNSKRGAERAKLLMCKPRNPNEPEIDSLAGLRAFRNTN